MTALDTVDVAVRDAVLTITINRPQVLNAIDPPTHRRLHDVFDDFANDDSLHMAVIRGAGERAFCTGSDLKTRASMGKDDMPATGFAGLIQRFDLTKPVIAAVNGHAVGGGFEIVLACDLAIAVRGAKFGLPETRVGLAAHGGLHRLARQLPMKQAMQIALGGELFDADTALRLGLINDVVEPAQFDDSIADWLTRLRAASPLALRASKQMLLKGLDAGGVEQAFAANYPAYEAMLASDDAQEGMAAFNEKRKPRWQGR